MNTGGEIHNTLQREAFGKGVLVLGTIAVEGVLTAGVALAEGINSAPLTDVAATVGVGVATMIATGLAMCRNSKGSSR